MKGLIEDLLTRGYRLYPIKIDDTKEIRKKFIDFYGLYIECYPDLKLLAVKDAQINKL